MSNVIKLDVGGVLYKTTKDTLTKDQDSMLASMFSGRHPLQPDENGYYFIDRDGELFKYIIKFLRDGNINLDDLPKNIIKNILDEAKYYCLDGLIKLLESNNFNIVKILEAGGINIEEFKIQFNEHFTTKYVANMIHNYEFYTNDNYTGKKCPFESSIGYHYCIGPPKNNNPHYDIHLEKYNFLKNMYDKCLQIAPFRSSNLAINMFNDLFIKNLIQTNVKCFANIYVWHDNGSEFSKPITFDLYI